MARAKRRTNLRAQGSIVPRPGSRWLIRWYIGRSPEGKRKYESKTIVGTRLDAMRELAKRCGERQPGAQPREPEPLEGYLKHWLAEVLAPKVTAGTARSYAEQLEPIIARLGSCRLDRIATHDIQAVYNSLSESGLAPRNVRYTHTVLKAALKHAVRVRLIPSNPCEHLSLPRRNHREATVWTMEQAQAFLQATHDDPKLRADHLLWYTLLHTGLRPGEAFGLQWENLEENKLRIVRAVAEGKHEGEYVLKEPKTRRAVR